MTIRNTSQRNVRRRRVLTDDRSDSQPQPPRAKRAKIAARRYPPYEDLVERLPNAACLVPIRPFSITVAALLIANLVALHAAIAGFREWARHEFQLSLSPLALTFDRNLATTTVGLTCIAASIYSAIVLGLRKHRVDDYRGRYRLWYFVTTAAALFGVGVLTGAGGSLWQLAAAFGNQLGLPKSAWWEVMTGLVAAAAVGRLVAEVRSSHATVGLMFSATCCLILARLVRLKVVALPAVSLENAATVLSVLAAACLFAFSLAIYARHILLDAFSDHNAADTQDVKSTQSASAQTTGETVSGGDDDNESTPKRTWFAFWRRFVPRWPTLRRRGSKTNSDDSQSGLDATKPKRAVNQRVEKPAKSKANPVKPKRVAENVGADNASFEDSQDDDPSSETSDSTSEPKLSRAERKRLRREKRRSKSAA